MIAVLLRALKDDLSKARGTPAKQAIGLVTEKEWSTQTPAMSQVCFTLHVPSPFLTSGAIFYFIHAFHRRLCLCSLPLLGTYPWQVRGIGTCECGQRCRLDSWGQSHREIHNLQVWHNNKDISRSGFSRISQNNFVIQLRGIGAEVGGNGHDL